MELAIFIYLAGVLDTLHDVLIIAIPVATVLTFFMTMVFFMCDEEDEAQSKAFAKKAIKYLLITVFVSFSVVTLTPDKKTSYTMLAAYAGQQIATSHGAQEISSKVMTIINQQLDSVIAAGRDSVKGK